MKRLFCLLVLVVLLAAFASGSTLRWLRGEDEFVAAEGYFYYGISANPPEYSSTATAIEVVTEAGQHELTRWYSAPLADGLPADGNAALWLSHVGSDEPSLKIRMKLYSYDDDTAESLLFAESEWAETGAEEKEIVLIAASSAASVAEGRRLKAVLEYESAAAGKNVYITIDEGGEEDIVWQAPDDSNYSAEGVSKTGALLLDFVYTERVAAACSNNAGCDDGNILTTDICMNAGTTEAYCTSTPTEICDIKCYSDAGCDDQNPLTTDNCVNSGGCNSYCSNEACTVSCYSGAECDDGNPLTADSCIDAGRCGSVCSNIHCEPMCSSNSDCDDNDASTTDVCAGSGRCTAICVSMPACGDGTCSTGENETPCSCPQDCGSCYEKLTGTCRERNCIGKSCRATITLGCCGNGICELNEDYSNCSEDCRPKNVTFTLEDYDETEDRLRGEDVLLKASVTADGVRMRDAEVSVSGFFGSLRLFNDGRHNDGTAADNTYANTFTVDRNFSAGDYTFKFRVDAAGSVREYFRDFKVNPVLGLGLTTDKPVYILSDLIKISGSLRKKNRPLDMPVGLTIRNPAGIVADENLTPLNGVYAFSYRSATIQEAGKWRITAVAEDGNGNYGEEERLVEVLEPGSVIALDITTEAEAAVSRGDVLEVRINVKDTLGRAGDANIAVEAFGRAYTAEKVSEGSYLVRLAVGFLDPLGLQEADVSATRTGNTISYRGRTSVPFEVKAVKLAIEVLEPAAGHYLAGETIPLKVSLTYPDGSGVENARVTAFADGIPLSLEATQKGIYYAEYVAMQSTAGILELNFEAEDLHGNAAAGSISKDISGFSVMYYVRRYGTPAALLLLAIIIVLLKAQSVAVKGIKKRVLRRREKNIMEIIKGLQYQYFREASIDRKTYESELHKYEEELKEIRQNMEINEGLMKKGGRQNV
jgi:hypothetical protein